MAVVPRGVKKGTPKPSERVQVREALYKAAIGHFTYLGHSVNREFGLNRKWGEGVHLRSDLFTTTLKGYFTCVEIKSGWADLSADSKLHLYQPFCHRLFIVTTAECWEKAKDKYPFPDGCGVLVLDRLSGYLRSVRKCRYSEMDDDTWTEIVLRIAWRNGAYSKRNTKRYRVYY